MNNKEFLYNELQKQGKELYLSGKTMNLFIIYIENKTDNYYKVYLFKEYSNNLLDYTIFELNEPFNTLYKYIIKSKFKKALFYKKDIVNISNKISEYNKFNDYIYINSLNTYKIALSLIESLIIDYNNNTNQKSIDEINNNKIIEILYLNEIIKIY